MTGIGTKSDPYIADNWQDFITAIGTSGAYVELAPDAQNKVLDLNEIQPEGFTSGLSFQCKSFKGNGWKIINYTVRLSSGSTTLIYLNGCCCDGLNFLNFYAYTAGNATVYLLGGYETCSLANSRFSGLAFGRFGFATDNENYTRLTIPQSAFYLRITGAFVTNQRGVVIQLADSRVRIDGRLTAFNWLNQGFRDSYITGNIEYTGTQTGAALIAPNSSDRYGGISYNTVFDLNITAPASQTPNVIDGGGNANIVVNTDRITNIVVQKAIAATTNQLSNAKWLSEQGFPVGVA